MTWPCCFAKRSRVVLHRSRSHTYRKQTLCYELALRGPKTRGMKFRILTLHSTCSTRMPRKREIDHPHKQLSCILHCHHLCTVTGSLSSLLLVVASPWRCHRFRQFLSFVRCVLLPRIRWNEGVTRTHRIPQTRMMKMQ